MLIQILDVDYVMVDDKPVIRIFGKNGAGEAVCGFYEGFLPYFYVAGENAEEVLKDEDLNFEKVKRNIILKHVPQDVFKITLKDPSKTPEIRDRLRSKGLKPYEADILFKYRFMSDMGINGMNWIDITGPGIQTESVSINKIIQIKKMKAVEKTGNADLKTLAFDLECVSNRGGIPEAKRDPIVMISILFSHDYKGTDRMLLSTRSGKGVTYFETEKAMLETFIKIVNDFDADILTGYNCNNFDFPYTLERMRQNGIRAIFGRCKQKTVFAKSIGNRHKVYMTGRMIVDSYTIVKKDFSLVRYDLGTVAKNLLNEEKIDVKHSEIETLWRGNDIEFERLAKYAMRDSVLAINLLRKLDLTSKYIALSKISGTLLQDTLDGGETLRIENYLLREFNKKKYIFPCKPEPEEMGRRMREREENFLKGGYVIEPKKGLHSNVVVLDFKSMYPSIINTFNICPTTLTRENGDDVIKSLSGAMFCKKSVKKGIVPDVLENLMKSRQAVKMQMKKETDKEIIRVLDAQQWALKIMANAFYGYLGYLRAKAYYIDIANSVTSYGRNLIQNTSKSIKKMGYEIIYGDTDSVMVQSKKIELDDIEKEMVKIVDIINKDLEGILELEFEKIFKRFLPFTKKRYVALCFERDGDKWKEKMEMKGVETVRRDWCELTSETMKRIVEILLKENDVKGAVNHFKNVIGKLMKGEIAVQKLAVTKSMSKSPERYVGMQPHIELVKKIRKRSPEETPGIGDRIPYVIVKGLGLLSKRAEDPMYVIEHGIQVDSSYYIENQLLPPLERIFTSLGIFKSELMGNGKQMGIMDAIKNHVKAAKETEKEKEIIISSKEMNGFVCSKCNDFHRRVPLVGVCECGGEFLFSSPKGTATTIVAG
ncbi:MAG: hypothetical protein ISS36_00095 [Candidatus Aenigmarchaeota archaeon]|nr:hypothetical protein [Candidatus Aenigmarchaeota archaeon]